MAQPATSLPADLFEGGSDDNGAGVDFDTALDDFMGNSDILREAGISTREEQDEVADDADADDDLGDSDESGGEEDEADGDDDAVPELEEDDDSDEDSTDDNEEEDGDDDGEIDWDFKVPVKIDGEDGEVDLGELVKGYQTSQHLSKKGRELADERKAFEEERNTELEKVKETAKVLSAQSAMRENELATEYTDLQKQHKEAKADGDKYKAEELKDQMEEIQQEYWKARKTRERIAESLNAHEEEEFNKQMESAIKRFNEEIADYVPDFDENKATEIREFALSKGIPEEMLQTLVDAKVIGAINEFMELSKKISKGSAKRKATPKRTPASTKKAKPTSQKAAEKRQATSRKIASGKFDDSDADAALDALVGKYFS